MSVVVTGGQRNDGAVLQAVIDDIRAPQPAGRPGRPRTRPDAVMVDRAYQSRANREHLRGRGIVAVIPEKVDHVNARKPKDSNGGQPPKTDWEAYRGRNVVERSFNLLKALAEAGGRVRQARGGLPRSCCPGRDRRLDQGIRRHALGDRL